MPSLVLGTAGHIDHGKSSLIKALTGTDPDRLAEEKARGITIELGFAQLDLPSGRSIGVVDVPGHEKFVRQMVAGATGIDVVLLVIAADDGVMPQTREHLAIIDLLGISRGIVAITKADLVDEDWIELVRDDVANLLVGTSIEGAPLVNVSSKSGTGLPELVEVLDRMSGETPSRQASLSMRLPVDRVFTISGAGTVVTGTMWSGTAHRDDSVEIMPGGTRARIRGVQVHSESVDEAHAGQRVALNIAGVEKSEISRGDIIAAPDTLTVSDRFDARVTYLGAGDEKVLESGARVHVHHGTREVLGRVLLMDDATLAPGQSALAQIRLEEPLSPRYEDRFIIRSYSPVYTIGGGSVLDALPPRRTKLKEHERELLDALVAHDLSAASVGLLAARGLPMSSLQTAAALGVQRSQVADELNRAKLERFKVGSETYFVTTEAQAGLLNRIEAELLAFHQESPKATGIAAAALRDRIDRRLDAKVFDALLSLAVDAGTAALGGGSVRHPKAAVSALAEEETALAALGSILISQGLSPSGVTALAEEAGVDVGVARKVHTRLVAESTVVRLGPELHFDAAAMSAAREKIETHLRANGEMLAKDARDLLGTSRKYVMPILEYFDAQGLTRRDGDVRVLRRG
ncbi:MAG: selenocysteine-specific translation elongation factor [Actinomycetota bacterium]|jgi:selenocysteine-specific elongation factor|nr:selenocysteine-specific translation elongation factor [Actinomycetota bacterium]